MFLWPLIKHKYPKAELHLYYGMDLVEQGQKQRMQSLINSQDGVIDHGRVAMEELNKSRENQHFSYI